MNNKNKLFLCFGVFGIIMGIIGINYKPKFLNKFKDLNKKNIIPILAIVSGVLSLLFVADDYLLPEQEEVVTEEV